MDLPTGWQAYPNNMSKLYYFMDMSTVWIANIHSFTQSLLHFYLLLFTQKFFFQLVFRWQIELIP